MNTLKDDYKHIRAYRCGALLQVTDWLTIVPWLRGLARKTTSSLSAKGLDNINAHEGHLFITNHRDIVMDSAWLSLLLRTHKNIRPYVGTGNNLFGKWWIKPLVRMNRAFVVIRDGSLHEQLANSRTLSHYISDRIHEGHSVWLAQREGRAKDGNDLTQPAVLKMLALAHEGSDFIDTMIRLNICPTSISYEYDPCDYLKAQEMQLKRDIPGWHKSKQDDLTNMHVGMHGWKGQVVFHFTPSITPWLQAHQDELRSLPRNEQIQAVAAYIDQQIHSHYEIVERGTEFEDYLNQQVAKINIPNKDEDFLRAKLREMYANPVINYEKSHLPGQF